MSEALFMEKRDAMAWKFRGLLSHQYQPRFRSFLLQRTEYIQQKFMILLLVEPTNMTDNKHTVQAQFLPDAFSSFGVEVVNVRIDGVMQKGNISLCNTALSKGVFRCLGRRCQLYCGNRNR